MKIGLLISVFVALTGFSSLALQQQQQDEEKLSPAEEALCRKAGCFSQGVAKGFRIKQIGPEKINVNPDGQKYLNRTVVAQSDEVEVEFNLLMWVGAGPFTDQRYLTNAREFAKALDGARKSGQKLNLVHWGHANNMTAKFPLLGFFGDDGTYFFVERASVPLFSTY